jgi:hypothetical protein
MQQKEPDFSQKPEENILLKGMWGLVNIIPNMISAIPNPINAFTTKPAQDKQK